MSPTLPIVDREPPMLVVPAVCENEQCGRVFLAHLAIASTLTIEGIGSLHVMGCPHCGHQGSVPRGRYTTLGDTTSYVPLTEADYVEMGRAIRRSFKSAIC